MSEVLHYAIPFFLLLLAAEAASFRHLSDEDHGDLRATPGVRNRFGVLFRSPGWRPSK